jgi:hypothetical protein
MTRFFFMALPVKDGSIPAMEFVADSDGMSDRH